MLFKMYMYIHVKILNESEPAETKNLNPAI